MTARKGAAHPLSPLMPGVVGRFCGLVLSEIRGLHEGNFMRYGIWPTEFTALTSRGGSEEPGGPGEPLWKARPSPCAASTGSPLQISGFIPKITISDMVIRVL